MQIYNFLKHIQLCFFFLLFSLSSFSNDKSKIKKVTFNGQFQSNIRYYIDDQALYTEQDKFSRNLPPQVLERNFEKQIGSENWLRLGMLSKYVDLNIRFDGFYNSNLHNPTYAFNMIAIGFFNAKFKYKHFELQAGHIYEQLGSGSTFRSFEERGQGLDYSLLGGLLKFNYKNISAKIIGGKQRSNPLNVPNNWTGALELFKPFYTYESLILGANAEYFLALKKLNLNQGISFVTNLISDNDLNAIKLNISISNNPFTPENPFYLIGYYNQFNINDFNFGIEFNYKTKGPVLFEDPITGIQSLTDYKHDDGMMALANFSYAKNNFGGVLQVRYLKTYEFKARPDLEGNNGYINYLTSLSKLHTYRLTGRYAPRAYYNNEIGYQLDLFYSIKKYKISAVFSDIRTANNIQLYLDAYLEQKYAFNKNIVGILGVQYLRYNQKLYQNEGDLVNAFTYLLDFKFKFKNKMSLKTEFSQMITSNDLGSWLWAQADFYYKSFSFAIGDMYNYGNPIESKQIHYFNLYTNYAFKKYATVELAFVRQPHTVICNGGICRIEPAFSGVKFGLKLNF